MYHPTRGGVRGGRDQFKWDDVKVDKHRENYIGHSVKAPVGRWQKGKDLLWYTRDKNPDALKAIEEEKKRIKEEEEQAMREALGLAPKRASRPTVNRLDKYEYAELVKRESTAQDLGAGHAEAAQVQGLGLYKLPCSDEQSSSLQNNRDDVQPDELPLPLPSAPEEPDDSRKRRRHDKGRDDRKEERNMRRERHGDAKDRRRDKHESDDRRSRKDKHSRRRQDSD